MFYLKNKFTFRRNHGEKFCCEECGKEFLTKLKLKNHALWHSSKYAFQCQHCPKKFKAKNLLVEHERIHTGERPFVCSHCPKAFRLKVLKNGLQNLIS